MSALQSQYEQRIAKLESELRGALEAKESLEAAYRQLKYDPGKTQDVWMIEYCCDFQNESYNYIAGQDRQSGEGTEVHEGQAVGGNKPQVAEMAE